MCHYGITGTPYNLKLLEEIYRESKFKVYTRQEKPNERRQKH